MGFFLLVPLGAAFSVFGRVSAVLLVGLPLLWISSLYPQTAGRILLGTVLILIASGPVSLAVILWRERHEAFGIPRRHHGPAPGGGATGPESAAVPPAATPGTNR